MKRKLKNPLPSVRHSSAMKSVRMLALLAGWLTCAGSAFAGVAGTITHLSGTLSVKRSDGATRLLSVKSEVMEGDLLSTEAETYARIKMSDGGEVVMRPGTQLKVESYVYNEAKPGSDNVVLSMLKGGLRAVTGLVGKRNQDKVNFTTNTATIGIRGTHFGALLCQGDCAGVPTVSGVSPADGLHVDVASGAVVVSNAGGQQVINTGQFGYVQNPQSRPVVVPPNQGIQVTMPNSIAQNKGSGGGIGDSGASECKM